MSNEIALNTKETRFSNLTQSFPINSTTSTAFRPSEFYAKDTYQGSLGFLDPYSKIPLTNPLYNSFQDRAREDLTYLSNGNVQGIISKLINPMVATFDNANYNPVQDYLGNTLPTPNGNFFTDTRLGMQINLKQAALKSQIDYARRFLEALTTGNVEFIASLLQQTDKLDATTAYQKALIIRDEIINKNPQFVDAIAQTIDKLQARIKYLDTEKELNDKQTQDYEKKIGEVVQGFNGG